MNPGGHDPSRSTGRGRGDVLNVGVLTPHAAPGPEVEIPEMASGRVTTVLAHVRLSDGDAVPTGPSVDQLRSLADPGALDRAAAPFRGESLDAVAHASTSTSYLLGHVAEAELVDGIRRSCGVPVVASGSSAVRALRACGSRHVVLVHPPWFDDEVDELGSGYFREQGFDVSLSKADGIPDNPSRVRPEHVVDWVVRHVGDEADAVFIGGNGFRAARAIAELERRTGLLVLESNQVLLWSIMAATRTAWDVTGYGRLLETAASGSG